MARATWHADSAHRTRRPGPRLAAILLLGWVGAGMEVSRGEPPPASPAAAWYRTALVGMEVGPTGAQSGSNHADTGYAARFDGRAIVEQCARAGSEYVVIWARDGEYAYYNSRILPKCPGLGDRDVLREAVEAGRAQGLPIIAYCVVQQGGAFLAEHPEFAMRGPDGKPIGRYCFNSGYLETMKALTSEMLACGIAGFHIDMLDQGFGPPYGCWCDACRRGFEAAHHRPMPTAVTWDEAWDLMLEFRYLSSQKFERALRAHIREVAPATTVDFNYHGNPPFSWEVGQRPVQHAGNGDFVTGETGVWGFSALGVGLNAEFYRAAAPGLPFQVAMQRGVRVYHDQTTRPINDLRWELFTLLAHGAFVTVVDKTAYDGWLDPIAYRRIGKVFQEARGQRDSFVGQPVQDVGIYFSSRTRDWFGREEPARYFQAFQGAHRAMVLEHLLWGVVLDENASLETLRRFAVVMLPNAAILADRELATLRRYVEDGGSLLVTGWTGLLGPRGEAVEQPKIASLTGARLVRRLDSRDNHVRLPSGPATAPLVLAEEIDRDWPFLVEGPAAVYEPTTATPIGELLRPHRTLRQQEGLESTDMPMSAGEPVGPAALLHTIGKGRVLTLASSPDVATAGEHAIMEARKLLAGAVRVLCPHPRVRVEAPAFVEVVALDDSAHSRLQLHFLAYAPTPMTTPAKNRPYVIPGLIEDAPVYAVRVQVRDTLKRARTARNGEIPFHGGDVAVQLGDVHEILTLEYGK